MSDTIYIGFSAIDYKGSNSLSSYALPLTPLKFIINSNEIDGHKRVVWDFGDGTLSDTLSTSKYFDFPGVYEVNLIVYDCNNNAMVSTQSKTITIYDLLPFTFNIDTLDGYLLTEDGDIITDEDGNFILLNSLTELTLKCGEIYGPLIFNSYYPLYQTPSDIYYSITDSASYNYWNLTPNKFNHLERFNTLYETIYNYSLSSTQYVEIDKIKPVVSKLYAKISNNTIVYCLSTEEGAIYVGSEGINEIYIKDDSPSNRIYVKFWFDKLNNKIPNISNPNYLNNLGVTLSASVADNQPTHLSITSNGLDGEGYPITSFNIDSIKIFDTKIPFVVKLKDVDNFSIKNFDKLELETLIINVDYVPTNVSIVDKEYVYTTSTPTLSDYTIYDLNYSMSEESGAYFRGYIVFNSRDYDYLDTVTISVSASPTSYSSNTYTLEGQSSEFKVYRKNFYDIWVKNENFNPKETLMDLRFQEVLLDKNILFEELFGSILGDENSDHGGIGVKLYEKIANFVSNSQDLDSCEQEFIDSMGEFTGYNDNIDNTYVYPDSIKRLMSLASMDKNKLIGELNRFNENLDIKGRTSKDEFGINIGDEINTISYVISAGTPIVALEKFSNSYTLLNTYQPVSSVGSHIYPLSTYSSDWGWPLVLPITMSIQDMKKYYIFYGYNDQYDNTSVGGLIDFENSKTTIIDTTSYNDLFRRDGIFTTMFIDSLYQSLSLVQ